MKRFRNIFSNTTVKMVLMAGLLLVSTVSIAQEEKESSSSTSSGVVVHGSVYGGGNMADVQINTVVNISKGIVEGNVYGGGNLGDVGTIVKSNDYNYKWTNEANPGETYTYNNTGLCTVNISGGQVGAENKSTTNHASGHVFGAGKGVDDSFYCEKGMVYKTNVTISKGTVYGNVYGGGQIGRVENDAVVSIEGTNENDTEIKGDVFGAGAGLETHGYSALLRGDATVTVQGKTKIGGNVYGGGETASVGRFRVENSLPKEPLSGGTCTVTIKNDAEITGNVFGACKGVTPADYSNATHVISGNNSLGFGDEAEYLSFLKTLALTSNTLVTIDGNASINSSVYGGGQRGITLGRVEVNMTGGTVSHDVYGGGALADTNTGNWNDGYGTVAGITAETTIVTGYYTRSGAGTVDDPYVYTEITTANTKATANTTYYSHKSWAHATLKSAYYKTFVNILGGTVVHDVYGGGLGDDATPAYVWGDVKVNLNGLDAANDIDETLRTAITGDDDAKPMNLVNGVYQVKDTKKGAIVDHVFGCNNVNGTPKGEVLVHVHATQSSAEGKTTVSAKSDKNTNTYDVEAVYGGGNQAEYYPVNAMSDNEATKASAHTNVIIDGCRLTSIKNVYGGGNAASTPSTSVTVNGAYEIYEVFGGGNGYGDGNPGANVGFHDYSAVESTYPTKAQRQQDDFINTYVYGSGKASVNIFGGTVHRVFGGSNTKGNVRITAITMLEDKDGCDFCMDEAYGGGKSAPMDAEAKLHMACIPGLRAAYGGAEAADVLGDVTLNITNGTFDRVFGGNNLSGTISGSITVNIEETGCKPIIIGELYGGGNQAAYSVFGYKKSGTTNVIRTSKDDGEAFYTPTTPYSSNQLFADPQVNVKSFTSIGNIYGGGLGTTATMVGNPTVNVSVAEGAHKTTVIGENAKTYSDDNGKPVPSHAEGKIGAINNVYGGGNAADVVGNTNVNIGTDEYVYVTKEFAVGASVANYYIRTGAGTAASPYAYTSASGTATENETYYERQEVVGVDIRGNVYGGGYGSNTTVTGDVKVNVGGEKTEGTTTTFIGGDIAIGGSVYGGSALGAVNATRGVSGLSKTDDATTEVTLKKGNITGAVYGGGKGEEPSTTNISGTNAKVYGDALVTLYGDVVAGGIYGGCDQNGTMYGNTQLDLLGGRVGTAFNTSNVPSEIPNIVFGGGLGALTTVVGDVTVNVNQSDKTPNGVAIYSNVYGGSKNGSVGKAVVNLLGGAIWGDVFGGGYSTDEGKTAATDVIVTLNGTAFGITYEKDDNNKDVPKTGRIFGCNNLQGSPTGNVTVNVLKTTDLDADHTKTASDKLTSTTQSDHYYNVQAVYGGGNLAAYAPTTTGAKSQVNISGCDDTSIEYVYGGGNAAPMHTATNVQVEGAYEIGYTFGGGNGSDKIKSVSGNTVTWTANPGADVNGSATSTLIGGYIHNVFGGSNTKGTITGEAKIDISETNSSCNLITENVYGAGMNADVVGDVNLRIGCLADNVKNVYGGAMAAKIDGNVTLTITSGILDNVYGGNNQSGSISGKITVNIEETDDCKPVVIGNLYGGGNLAPYPGPDLTNNDPNIEVNVKSFTSIGNVYGGGRGSTAIVTGNTVVNINEVTGRWASTARPAETRAINEVEVLLPEHKANEIGAIGNVYGSGDAAAVYGNTMVNIATESTVDFVSIKDNLATENVIENRFNVLGANITGNVYGGGKLADVTGNTFVNICAKKSGNDYVAVAEGASKVTIDGNVFGGGKGEAAESGEGAFTCEKAMVGINNAGLTDTSDGGTTVIIGNGTVNGTVYGGGEIGRVEKNTKVTIGLGEGVETGTPTSAPEIKGNVFGGGQGEKHHGYAGLVRGNPTVTIKGNAKVRKSVYGGGEIASVARYKLAEDETEATEHGVEVGMPYVLANANSGYCNVTVGGYAEIGPETGMKMYHSEITDGSDTPDDYGHVFGAGKGILPEVFTYVDHDHQPYRIDNTNNKEYYDNEDDYFVFIQTLALSTQTNTTIGDHAFVKGSVYGGSENGLVQFDTNVTINSGQIGAGEGVNRRYTDSEWASGSLAECAHWKYEAPYAPYDPNANATDDLDKYPAVGTQAAKSTEGGRRVASDGHTYYGNVFGGGSGSVPYFDTQKGISRYIMTAGQVKGNTTVTINGGHILTNVYGGCEATNVLGTATITMTDGTIGVPRTDNDIIAHPVTGYIFGGGKGDQRIFFNKDTNVENAVVNVIGGRIYGSVYGGGEDGHVLKNVTLTIGETGTTTGPKIGTRGTSYYDGHVFGGGRGFGGEALTAGNVGGSVVMHIYGGEMLGSVYGGGRLASVGYGLYLTTEEGYGVMRSDNMDDKGNAVADFKRGYITMNIGGGTIGNDVADAEYGGNVFGGSMGRLTKLDGSAFDTDDHWSLLATAKKTTVNITGGIIKRSVYGGGELGTVTTDAIVNISGGTIGTADKGGAEYGNVYGGGKGYVDPVGNNYITAGIIKGNTNVQINGTSESPVIHHNIYGGGAYGSVGTFTYDANNVISEYISGGKATVIIKGGKIGEDGSENGMIFGSSRGDVGAPGSIHDKLAWVYDTEVTIGGDESSPRIVGSVYGGGENGHNYHDAVVNIHSGTIGIASGSTITNNNGTPDDPTDDISYSGAEYPYRGNVYGGGCGTDKYYSTTVPEGHTANDGQGDKYNPLAGIVYGTAKVAIDGGTVIRNIYGAGAMGSVGTSDVATSGKTTIDITGGTIGVSGTVGDGNVFGAARGDLSATDDNLAQVRETSVTVSDGDVKGSVYGGGEAGHVKENTTVNMSGGTIGVNVYGGGNLGNVGTFTETTDGRYVWTAGGLSKVEITGGKVGIDGNTNPEKGNVFGAGKGKEDTFKCEKAMVKQTSVTVSNGTVNGNVFGGGEVGRVEYDTEVKIGDGVGTEGGTSAPTIAGSVFGGGAGVATHGYSALVRGNTTVTVEGNAVVGKSVYGGGEIASVGRYGLDAVKMPSILLGGGYCYVTVQGHAKVGSDVFGAGKGVETRFDKDNADKTKRSRRMTLYTNATDFPEGAGTWEYYETGSPFVWEYFQDEDTYSTYLETLALSTHPEVTIDGNATINGSVYGGGEVGLTKGSVVVNIKGGTIVEDVYGGGALANTNTTSSVGKKDANDVPIKDSEGNIETETVHPTTTVNLLGGTIERDAYGGGLGRKEVKTGEIVTTPGVEAIVYGNVLLELNKGVAEDAKGCIVLGNIFGANNVNGTPKGHVMVHIYATQNRDLDDISTKSTANDVYDVVAVYGGGNQADYVPDESESEQSTEVIIEGCGLTSIENVYGGGYGAATPGTKVLIRGTKIIDNVFGGGYGAGDNNPGANVGYRTGGRSTYGKLDGGKAIIQLMAGTVNNVYGGSNTKGDIRGGSSVTNVAKDGGPGCCDKLMVREVYGGGNEADMYGGAEIVLDCMPDDWIEEIYAGAKNADVENDVSLTLTSGKFGRVFGGNKSGGKIDGSITLNIEESEDCEAPLIIGELYGGGNEAAYSAYGYGTDGTPLTEAQARDAYTGEGEYPGGFSGPWVNVKSFTSIGNIYGGGKGQSATLIGNPRVLINEVLVEGNNNVAYNPDNDTDKPAWIDGVKVKLYPHEAGKMGVIGNVFGGGNAADVKGNTSIEIGTGDSRYNTDSQAKVWFESTFETKNVVGADIRGNVYGGGNEAQVTGNTNVVVGKEAPAQ